MAKIVEKKTKENETAAVKEEVPKTKVEKETQSKKSKKEPKKRSKKYVAAKSAVEPGKAYPIDEALELLKSVSYAKFDATVNLAIHLERSKKAQEESIRGVIKLPFGTGKKMNVVVASDEIIEAIKKNKTDFDILVASPEIMPRLAQVAKILGLKGKMPNPKDGTVVEKPEDAVLDLSQNTARYRSDVGRNIHVAVGRISWEKDKLLENIQTVLKALAHLKKSSITLSTAMSPGIKLDMKL